MVSGVLTSNAHIGFEVVDGSFYGSSYFIEGIPFNGITLNPRKHAKFHVFIGVSSSALLSCTARMFTLTDPLCVFHANFRTAPFDTVGTPFFTRNATILHGQQGVIRASGISVFIVAHFLKRTFVTRVVWDQYFLESKVIFQEAVNVSRIKGGISQKSIRMKSRVRGKKVRENRL